MKPETMNLIVVTVIILVVVVLPAIIHILRLTSWGRANKQKLDAAEEEVKVVRDALDNVVGAVADVEDTFKRINLTAKPGQPPALITAEPAEEVKKRMRQREQTAPLGTVLTWKDAVTRARARLSGDGK